jgi:acetyl-CoA acetyltransferase
MRAEDAAHTRKPVSVAGAGSSQGHFSIAQAPDPTRTPAVQSGRRAFAMAGMAPADIDHLMLYDSFTITPVLALEDLGFAGPGEATALVASGATSPGGRLPMNTNGGGLAFAHTGMYGVFTLIESVQQLRGEAGERQVPCWASLAHGVGDFLSAAGTVILTRDAA